MRYFVISDTHFGHKGMVEFLDWKGNKIRPFDTIEEHDQTIVDNWNRVVTPEDRVYHLGDCVINKKHLPTIGKLNGQIKLIKGNHDIFEDKHYREWFHDIYAMRMLPKLCGIGAILSHIPIHPNCLGRFGTNIHGHQHSNVINDPRYVNVCCEHINCTPVLLDDVMLGRYPTHHKENGPEHAAGPS